MGVRRAIVFRTMLRPVVVVAAIVLGCSGNSTGPNAHGVADISMSPDSLNIAIGDSAAIRAQPVSASGVPTNDTSSLFWSTSDSTIASVDQHGLVRAVGIGSVNIDASIAGVSPKHPARIVVVAVPVATIVIAPTVVSVGVGGAFQFTDTTKDASGRVLTGRTVVWKCSDTTVAKVDQAGLVLAKTWGSATITVSSGSARAAAAVTVTSAPPPPPSQTVARIALTPNRFTIRTHGTQPATAQALDASGHVIPGVSFVWTTKSGGSIASVDARGDVDGVAPGNDSVFASAGGVTGGAAVTVILPPVATVVITPGTATITNSNNSSVQLTATLLDARGDTLVGPAITWSSDNPDVAVVTSTGVVTPSDGGSHGTATIRATSQGKQGTASVTVTDGGGG